MSKKKPRMYRHRCAMCGQPFESAGPRAKYCPECKASEEFHRMELDKALMSVHYRRDHSKLKKKSAAERAADIRDINETARAQGMSYGKYLAPVVTVTIPEWVKAKNNAKA